MAWLKKRGSDGKDIPTSVVVWGRLVELLDSHLLGRAWARPLPEVPRPRAKSQRGIASRVNVTQNGCEVKESLLTPVPLEISDEQAFHLLFKDIQKDHDTIIQWAEAEVELAHARMVARVQLALEGVPYRHRAPGPSREERHARNSPSYLRHASATFEADGLSHLGNSTAIAIRFPKPYALTTWELGLPTPALLLAHGAVLVDEHPELTPAMLSEFNLYDAKGRRTGVQMIDGAWVMTGFKRRRGPKLAEQNVVLSDRALRIIRCLEAQTDPLRQWLKSNGHKTWRRLFLAIASIGRPPKAWSPNSEAHRQVPWISSRLVELLRIQKEYADALAARFSLRSVRASRGVLIYIDTCSMETMARALGHHQFRHDLLDHYLPKPIQDFFTERWIRLFQTGIVCEALKDSRHLLVASSFASMDALDSFLEHHMLRKIPPHINDQGTQVGHVDQTQLVFGLSEQNLFVLRSIELAVAQDPESACARAIRWARISERLFPHLERQTEQPELRRMAAKAITAARINSVDELIRA